MAGGLAAHGGQLNCFGGYDLAQFRVNQIVLQLNYVIVGIYFLVISNRGVSGPRPWSRIYASSLAIA